MSDNGVYGDEMARRFSDTDVELLLSGERPEQEGLARLAPLFEAMRREYSGAPDEETIAAFTAEASRVVLASSPVDPVARPRRRFEAVMSSRRFAATAAGFALVLGMTGVAAASDDAAPGHPLYGVDRTLESIGIGAGGPSERIAETKALLEGGQVSAAVAHLAEVVDQSQGEDESPDASAAVEELRGVAERLAGTDADPETAAVRSSVEAMLAEIETMIQAGENKGAEFGQRVAELARGLNDDDDAQTEEPETDEETHPSDEAPTVPTTSTSGPPDEVPGPTSTPPGTSGSPGNGPPGTGGSPGNGPPGTGGSPGNGPPGSGGSPGNGPPATGGSSGNGPPGGGPPGRP